MSVATLPPPLHVARRNWTTPQILWRAIWVLWICVLLMLSALFTASRVHSAALSTIGRDSAPNIIASQQIKTALADMDANAANELLLDASSGKEAQKTYLQRRREAATALIAAAQNIPSGDAERQRYGEAERVPIVNIQLGLGNYEALIQRARDLREARNPSFVTAYNQAAVILDNTLIPAADALDQANLKVLEGVYSGQRSRSGVVRALVFVGAALLVAILGVVQLFLLRRTHRIVNLPLFAASLLVLGFAAYSLQTLNAAEDDLKRAKEDAFTSIHALWRARAVAYAANSDESRYLLDPAHSKERTDAFLAKRDLLAKLPPNAAYSTEAQASGAGSSPSFTGYLADELNNITFPGEREAAAESLKAFGAYIDFDAKIRDLEGHGKPKEAIALCTRTAAGQSDWPFEKFNDAVLRTLKINQDAFDSSIKDGLAALKNFDVKAVVFSTVIAMLCLFGLLQRIREYQ